MNILANILKLPPLEKPLTIEHLECIPLAIPFSHGGPQGGFQGQDWSKIYLLPIRLQTSDGMVAWGDAFGYNCWRAVKACFDDVIIPLAIGKQIASPQDIFNLMVQIDRMLSIFGRNGILQFAYSGLDIALWDMLARAHQQPLAQLLGQSQKQSPKQSLPGYASLFRYPHTDTVAEKCAQATAEQWPAIKLHQHQEADIKAARQACGDLPLMVDTNCPWNTAQAQQAAHMMGSYNIFWLEEPLYPPDDYQNLAHIAQNSPVPLACGENASLLDFQHIANLNSATYLQPSVTKIGGITAFLNAAQYITDAKLKMMPHSPYFGGGFLATLHLASLFPDTLIEWFYLELEAHLIPSSALPQKGHFQIPSQPGIGITPDDYLLKTYAAT